MKMGVMTPPRAHFSQPAAIFTPATFAQIFLQGRIDEDARNPFILSGEADQFSLCPAKIVGRDPGSAIDV